MEIKTTDGNNHHVTGAGQGTYNTIAGSLGLASFLGLNLGGNGGGLFGGGRPMGNGSSQPDYVTKEEFVMAQTIAGKDAEIALLKSQENTAVKIADVYERLMTKINSNQREQENWNAQQAVYNAANNSLLGTLQSQVASLSSLTKVIVPATSICPQPMALHNSWTAPTSTTTTE